MILDDGRASFRQRLLVLWQHRVRRLLAMLDRYSDTGVRWLNRFNPFNGIRVMAIDRWPAGIAVPLGMVLGVGWVLGASILPLPVAVFLIGAGGGVLFLLAVSRQTLEPGPHPHPTPEPRPPGYDYINGRRPVFQAIDEGRFIRTTESGREQTVHVSAFLCADITVTNALYSAVTGRKFAVGAADEPVVRVSWYDAIRFCNAWSIKDQLEPCYQIHESDDPDKPEVTWNFTASGYRLLTEAEWEYACRAGSSGAWCFGDDEKELSAYAWFNENSDRRLHPVGEKKANAFGLFDVHGNVWEWVWDRYADYLDVEQVINPTGSDTGSAWVLRGGAFDGPAVNLRSANRSWVWFRDRNRLRFDNIGFRCARGPRRQP